MADNPYPDGTRQLLEAVNRLNLVLQEDPARRIGERIAVLESLPREMKEMKERVGDLEKTRLTKDQVVDAVKLALADERREQERAKLRSGGETKVIQAARIDGRTKIIVAVVLALQGLGIAAIALFK